MLLSQALNTVHKFTPKEFFALSDLLSPELIDECLAGTGIVAIRKRRLPMKMMVQAVAIGMAGGAGAEMRAGFIAAQGDKICAVSQNRTEPVRGG